MNILKNFFLTTIVSLTCFSFLAVYADNEHFPYSFLENRLLHLKVENHETTRLHQLFDLYWDWHLIDNPEEASFLGCAGLHDQWSDLSEEAFVQREWIISQCLEIVNSIEQENLEESDQISHQILKRTLEEDLADIKFGSRYLPISQMDGIHLYIPMVIDIMPNQTEQNYEDILSRLRLIPKIFNQTTALMQKGIELGITPPRVALLSVPQQILNQIVENPLESPLLEPFKRFPSDLDPLIQSNLLVKAEAIYQQLIKPTLREFYQYFTEQYLPFCRDAIGFTNLPNGKNWYNHLIQSSTTTSLSFDEIHEIGLKEVERIHNEMLTVIQSTDFKGTFDEFLNFITSDSQFFYSSREELLQGYRALTCYIESQLSLLFEETPSLPFEVIPVPSYSEESQIAAYYYPGSLASHRSGYFFINTSYPEERPKWEMEPLALHEAVPGHHLQISLAQELQDIPDFRKNADFTAYIEGWGLYAESLGSELGLYRDPYSLFGKLSYEMLRAIRLVVDTGMHAKGWTREEAIEFFKQYVGMSDHEIITEVDRYLVMPGQALAYKIGELKIQEMRRLATQQLGKKFDTKTFHHIWLQHGTLPLDIAEQQILKWIENRSC